MHFLAGKIRRENKYIPDYQGDSGSAANDTFVMLSAAETSVRSQSLSYRAF
jgi:hypothetical protein